MTLQGGQLSMMEIKIAAQNGRQNPITQFAIEGKAKFNYPDGIQCHDGSKSR